MYIVIPAGGTGTRLWPLSRSHFPKHLLNLSGRGTMIQDTVKRLSSLALPEQIIMLTEKSHAKQLQQQLPDIPAENYLIEPTRRDTAPVIGLGALHVQARDEQAVMASLHADHMIAREDKFIKILQQAEKVALQEDVIVVLGITPSYASTGFGYIRAGVQQDSTGDQPVFKVDNFLEKPAQKEAEAFLQAGNYYWNAGMFIVRPQVLLQAYEQYAPDIYNGLQTIKQAIGTPEQEQVLQEVYPQLPKQPIDLAIMEKADNIVMIPADIGWSDIGCFQDLKDILPPNYDSNLVLGQYVGLDTKDSFIYSAGAKLVTTIGLDKMIVVNTDDVVLVCPLERAQDIRELVEKLKEEQRDKYL